jgi:hypothetical protein
VAQQENKTSEVQEKSPLLDLNAGDVLVHKKGMRYVVEDTEAYYSEAVEELGALDPSEIPMVGYRAMYGERKKWFRPRTMFTEDRFTKDGTIHDLFDLV